jgi:spore germination cell wall hydrolase CwlJ-like protein
MYEIMVDKTHNRDLTCLALNVYHEARSEPFTGQLVVAEVTLNRVASKHYPDTICKVVYQQNWDRLRRRYVGAFSWTELNPKPMTESNSWKRAWEAAEAVYYKRHEPVSKGAMFYHANYIKPRWAKRKKPVVTIGKHIFYK